MNQILHVPIPKKKKILFKIVLYGSLVMIMFLIIIFIYTFYRGNSRNNMSYSLLQAYTVSKLYSSKPSSNIDTPHIIANIEIPSLSISLPVFSEINDELLKLSACRFYGPLANNIGNICIAGHNYDDGSFFSNLSKISIGDIVFLSDSSGQELAYKVYDKFEIKSNDTSCVSQDTNGKKEVTLVTCNNFTKNRIIVKCVH